MFIKHKKLAPETTQQQEIKSFSPKNEQQQL